MREYKDSDLEYDQTKPIEMGSKLISSRDQVNSRQPPDEIFSIKSLVSKRTAQEHDRQNSSQGPEEVDNRERYKATLRDKVSDNASNRQDKSSRSRSKSHNHDRSYRDLDRSRHNVSSLSVVSNHLSNRRDRNISVEKTSPLR
jgi:hypothetical protein